MALQVTGRVLAVRPRPDGNYGVTLGPGPDVYWFQAPSLLRLGTEVVVEAESYQRRPVSARQLSGTFYTLHGVRHRVVPPPDNRYVCRVVAPEWMARVQAVMQRPLFRYQVEGAAWEASRLAAGLGMILADDPGAGKTGQTIAALLATGCLPVVVVCPMVVKVNWAREFTQYVVRPPTVEIVQKRRGHILGADVVIVNYELLRYREEQLGRLGARAIVFDEAQRLKEPRPPLQHQAAIATRLGAWIGRAILLAGTPVENRTAELWRLLHIADPQNWPSYEDYHARYCRAPAPDDADATRRRVVTSYGRAERIDELLALTQPLIMRRLKSEVLVDLPPKSRRSVLVELDSFDMHRYRRAEADVVSWLRAEGAHQRAQRATRAMALVKFRHLRELAALGKIREAVPDYLRTWFDRPNAEPLVIFAYHRSVLYGNAEQGGVVGLCRALGLRAVGIGGKDAPHVKQACIDAFQRGEADVFVAPIASAGVGLNLHRSADALFLERVWVPVHMIQAEDRLHRVGQTSPVTATYLDAAGTIDEHLAAVAAEKMRVIRAVVGDDTEDALRTADDLIARIARDEAA